jgi:hypothetical protein
MPVPQGRQRRLAAIPRLSGLAVAALACGNAHTVRTTHHPNSQHKPFQERHVQADVQGADERAQEGALSNIQLVPQP